MVRSLKPGGKFYCQLGGHLPGVGVKNNLKVQTVDFQNGKAPAEIQRNGRTIDYAKDLVESCGGKIIFTSPKKDYKTCYWYYFIIEKA